jgi:DNA-binding sugar fermentation-stimulating protein
LHAKVQGAWSGANNTWIKPGQSVSYRALGRLIKHVEELGRVLQEGKRAVIALCYLYDAEPFTPPKRDMYNARVLRAATRAAKSGVERWQVNLGLDEKGVRVLRYLRNDTYSG